MWLPGFLGMLDRPSLAFEEAEPAQLSVAMMTPGSCSVLRPPELPSGSLAEVAPALVPHGAFFSQVSCLLIRAHLQGGQYLFSKAVVLFAV